MDPLDLKLKMYVVDAFTTRRFSGNQAAVVLLDSWLPAELMAGIARENNLSETAFVVRNPEGVFEIRWFSPLKEIDFCGHATLASAHVIFAHVTTSSEIVFRAKAVGNLTVRKDSRNLIEMAFPNREPVALDAVPDALREGLSVTPVAYLKNQQAYFAVLDDEEAVRRVVPDLERLKSLGPLDVVVTARGTKFDCVSRYFWPANGGAEDPVTGSIHAGLAPYWAQRLQKQSLVALQASERSGVLYCRVEASTVFVAGHCVDYLEGVIRV
jgi:PhzF family phenazine biosynthesis protein